MRIDRLSAAAALLALAAASVFSDPLDEALARSSYAQAEREQIAVVLRSAAERGIPLELTLPRLQEGVAKRAPSAAVRDVLVREIEALERARALLGALQPASGLAALPPAWQRAATLLGWGASAEEVTALASASSGRLDRFVQSGNLLVSLVQWGLDQAAAAQVAVTAAASRLPPGDLAGIVAVFSAGRGQRRDPLELARAIVKELPGSRTLRHLRERTLYE